MGTFRRAALVCACLAIVVMAGGPIHAAGTATVTVSNPATGVTKYSIAWTSTAGGAVSANPIAVRAGELLQVKFVPGSGGTQPTDLYDVTLVDENSVDVLAGAGANLSNAAASFKVPSFGATTLYRYVHDGTQKLDLVVAAAGASKTGTVVIWIR